jgi:hypothetical protein
VKLTAVHVNRTEPSLSLAFDYAEHDLYEIIWHHRDRLAGMICLLSHLSQGGCHKCYTELSHVSLVSQAYCCCYARMF